MKQRLLLFLVMLTSISLSAQISIKDSTVQTIGYWNKNEKQSYTITTDKIKLKGSDTVSKVSITCDVDVTILDSTAKSYTIEWKYKNYRSSSKDKIRNKIDAAPQDLKILIRTNEMGTFEEVINWQEVRDHMMRTSALLGKEFSNDPKFEEIMKEIEKIYTSKENIEAIAINDIQQFYMFHGGKYTKGETAEGSIQVPNVFGGKPFDAEIMIYLEEINQEDDNYVLRYEQSVDEQQLVAAVTEYIKVLAKKAGKTPPKDLGLKDMEHQTLTGSRIHDSGWVIYSILTKTVTTESTTNIEERVIEMK
ncbi:MAG: hypothetical protein ABL872_04835 [Lacibacter sp.]